MIKKIFTLYIAIVSLNAFGQKETSSPYSFFGIGESFKGKTVEEISMGGIGVSYSDAVNFGFSNPASYAALRLSTYTIGGVNRNLTAKDSNAKQSGSTTALSYLALGIPLGEKAGFSFGLQPRSSVGYSLVSENSLGEEVIESTAFQGNGGTNRAYLGIGFKIFKGLSVGIEEEYVFGNIENSIIHQRRNVQFATKDESVSHVNGFKTKFGMQYRGKISKKTDLSLGIAVSLNNSLTAQGENRIYTIGFGNGTEIIKGEIVTEEVDGKVNSPLKSTLGLGLGEMNKWHAGVEYSFQDALSFEGDLFQNNTKVQYKKSNRLSVGGFYIPKYNSISSYWNRVTYRAGFKFEDTGLLVNGLGNLERFDEIKDFGMSFGIGLPLGNSFSKMNLGFEYGKRGDISNGLVQENYFNFRVSLSLLDKWFNKRKID